MRGGGGGGVAVAAASALGGPIEKVIPLDEEWGPKCYGKVLG